jgi:hypothetical protein
MVKSVAEQIREMGDRLMQIHNDTPMSEPSNELDWDIVEDLVIFMKNDPDFYRRNVYPCMVDVQETVRHGGKFNKKSMLPIVEKAINEYIKKFDIKKRPEDLMNSSQKMECISKMLNDEKENFRKGTY